MPQDLTKIAKSSSAVYLAADDGALIFDDNDNTYLVISLGDLLKKILSNAATLTKILKQ